MSEKEEEVLNSAAIVCGEVADEGRPIVFAERSAPLQVEDSGWQFTCGDTHSDSTRAQVWSVREVIEFDPSLREYVFLPARVVLTRESILAPWKIRNVGTE